MEKIIKCLSDPKATEPCNFCCIYCDKKDCPQWCPGLEDWKTEFDITWWCKDAYPID